MDSHGNATEDTLAGRRGPSKLPPTLISSYRRPSADEGSLRSGPLRVVNNHGERLDSDASVLADQQSESTLPYNWSAGDFAADQDHKNRWRESVDSRQPQTQVPSSFHARTVDILVKLRLLPVMKSLQDPNDKGGLQEALRRAETILEFAAKENATQALQGRCCYYIGVAMHLLRDDEAAQYFVGALDAKGVYEEGRWAQQWTNHYESLGELSPNRVGETNRPVSWASNIGGYLQDNGPGRVPYAGSGNSLSQKRGIIGKSLSSESGERPWKPQPGGIQVTTPVSTRFSLDTHDEPFQSGTLGSKTPGSRYGSSVGGGESIPSFSTWDSSPSKRSDASRPAVDTDGLHSPKCAHVSPITETAGDDDDSVDEENSPPQSSPHHARSKSVTFDTTTLKSDVYTYEPLSNVRSQSSRFYANPPSLLEQIDELSIDQTDGSEAAAEKTPLAPDTGSEEETY